MVGLAQAPGHAGEQLAGEAGDLVEDAGELALAEHDELHVGLGDDGGVAGRLVEERELAERRRRGRGSRPCGRAGVTAALPSTITKNSAPVVALGHERLARRRR